jgi:RNA-binding protein
MHLTERQKKHLRREAHHLKPIVTVGDKGITETVRRELDNALEHHELIKIKVRAGDRAVRDEMIADLANKADATLLSRVGNIAIVYRQNKKKPKISLPKSG